MPKAKASVFSWSNVSIEQQRLLMDAVGSDGHTIFSADALKEHGLDAYVIDHFTTVEKSDGSWKGSITDSRSGNLVDELRGVYGLTVTRSLANHYGVRSAAFGRGTEARQLTAGILDIIGKEQGA